MIGPICTSASGKLRKQTNRRKGTGNENACQLLFVGPDPSLPSICEKFLTSSIFTAPFSLPLQPHRKTGALPAGRHQMVSIASRPLAHSATSQTNWANQPTDAGRMDGWMDADDGDSLTGSPCLSRPVSPLSKAPSSSAREGEKNVSQADKRTNNVLRSDDARSGGGLN